MAKLILNISVPLAKAINIEFCGSSHP